MPTPIQTATTAYQTSLDIGELKKAFDDFKRICASYSRFKISEQADPQLYAEKQASLELLICLGAKYLVLFYVQGYRFDRYEMLMSFLASGVEQAEKGGYTKAGNLCSRLQSYIKTIHTVATRAVATVSRIRDEDGRLSTPSPEVLDEVKETFRKTASELELELTDVSPFPDDVAMPNIKADLIRNFYEEIEWIDKQIGATRLANAERFIKENTMPLSEVTGLPRTVIAPSPVGMNTSATITVLSTPFPSEALFSVRAYAENVNKTFRLVSANLFLKVSEEESADIFASLKAPGIHLLITDINLTKEDRVESLYKQILRFSSPDNLVFIVDTVGDRKVYDQMNKIADGMRGTDALSVGYTFLKMPPFADVLTVFETNHLVGAMTEEVKDQIRRGLPFMGYVGLSGCVYEHTLGHDPFVYGEEISETNRRTASRYLSRLVASYQFIDNEWGDYSEGVSTARGEKRAFDYDVVRSVNPENVRIILQKPGLTLFERCAILTRYCTLSGDDVTVWPELPIYEKQIRMQDASAVLCSVLNTEYVPEVEVLDEEGWVASGYDKGAAGLCINGGKKIAYRDIHMQNYEFVLKCICHECFHAFQHTATNSPYSEWYFDEMGITRGRVSQWAKNFACYVGDVNSIAYKVEIVECDANAFADDCHMYAKTRWHEIEFV